MNRGPPAQTRRLGPPPTLSNRPRRRLRSAGAGARAERLAPVRPFEQVKPLAPVKHSAQVKHLGSARVEAGPALAPRWALREAPLEPAHAAQQRLCAGLAPPPCWWPMMNWEGRSAERRRSRTSPPARMVARVAARL